MYSLKCLVYYVDTPPTTLKVSGTDNGWMDVDSGRKDKSLWHLNCVWESEKYLITGLPSLSVICFVITLVTEDDSMTLIFRQEQHKQTDQSRGRGTDEGHYCLLCYMWPLFKCIGLSHVTVPVSVLETWAETSDAQIYGNDIRIWYFCLSFFCLCQNVEITYSTCPEVAFIVNRIIFTM